LVVSVVASSGGWRFIQTVKKDLYLEGVEMIRQASQCVLPPSKDAEVRSQDAYESKYDVLAGIGSTAVLRAL
jgi:hypothetical protein